MAHGRRTEVELVRDGRGRLCVAVPLVGKYAYGAVHGARVLHPVGGVEEARRYVEALRNEKAETGGER